MAIPILGEIERLITEHGSAVILKERVAQLREQMELLEKKATAFERENEELKTKCITLEGQVTNLRQEIQRRDDVIQKEKSHSERLEEVREKILLAVAQNEDATDQYIAQITGVTALISTYHLEELKALKMVTVSYTMGSDWAGTSGSTNWSIKQPGLSYLVAHGLIA